MSTIARAVYWLATIAVVVALAVMFIAWLFGARSAP